MMWRQATRTLEKLMSSKAGLLVIGVVIGFCSNYFLQSYILREEAAKETRIQRQKVYIEFLDKANAFNNSSAYVRECFSNFNKVHDDGSFEPSCNDVFSQIIVDRADFQDSLNQITIFGSEDAVVASGRIADVLPESLGTSAVGPGLPPIKSIMEHDSGKLQDPYVEFLKMACQELPALPRSNCAE